ncbi:MAG: substrate-binding domain-containing protein [Thermodesulfobacteriota bacterium]
MSFFIRTVVLAAFSTLLLSAPAIAGEAITLMGDPCSLPLAKKLSEAFSERNGAGFEITGGKCNMGVHRAAAGEVQIGVSTHANALSVLPEGTVNNIVAKSPIVLIVNKTNPVNDLTYEQVKGIFSGRIRNWKEVGGKDMEIRNAYLAPCVRKTMGQQAAPYGEDIVELKKRGNPVENANAVVAENEGALGQQIYGYHDDRVKVLTIDGLLPTEETLPARYRFYQDYNVVTKGEPTGAVAEFIKFARGPEGKEVIRAIKHIPTDNE